jgi:regulator of protease activity HflC (stomatin/prohibitin superfamily)
MYTYMNVYRTQTTLRHILGGKVLQECVENRESIAQEVEEITGRVAADWGVKVIRLFFFLD